MHNKQNHTDNFYFILEIMVKQVLSLPSSFSLAVLKHFIKWANRISYLCNKWQGDKVTQYMNQNKYG